MSDYWKKRFQMLEEASNRDALEAYRQIEPSFVKAQRQIEKEINTWVARVAVNNEVTMSEARKLLSSKELAEFKWDVNQYIEAGRKHGSDPVWMKQLENASARFHISKLEALQIRTQEALETAFGNETDIVDSMVRKTYSDGYYKTLYEVQKGFNTGWEVGQIDQRKLDKIVSSPWSTDGKTFSNRIWDRKTQMVGELQNQLLQTCILGKTPDDAVKSLEQYVNKSVKNAENAARRLVMTEQAYFHSESQKEAFKELGVEQYEIVATLDSKTSEICQEMDGQVFDMKDFESGVTAPPFHVYCRSVVAPYFPDDFGEIGQRAARDEVNDKTYYVPADMKYPEWKKAFVDGDTSGVTVKGQDAKMKATQTIFDALSLAYESNRIDNGLTSTPLGQIDDATNIIRVDVSKLSDESATSFSQTLKELVSEYNTPLTEFRTMTKMEALGNRNSFAFVSHNYEVDSAEMVLNPIKTKDFESHVNRIRELSEKGWCAKIKPENAEKYVVTHEFGHTILNIEQPLQNNRNWVNVDYKKIKKVRSEIQDVYSRYMTKLEDLTNDMKANELKFIMGTATDDEIEAVRRLNDEINKVKISKYSMTNVDEFLAESFANERLGVESNPYAKEVVDILDKYFKKKG